MKIQCGMCKYTANLVVFSVIVYHHQCELGDYWVVTVKCPSCGACQDFRNVERA